MKERLANLFRFLQAPTYSRTLGILGLFLLVAAIPLTVLVAQQEQKTRQEASSNQCNLDTYPTTFDSQTLDGQNQSAKCAFAQSYCPGNPACVEGQDAPLCDQARTEWTKAHNKELANSAPKANDGRTLFGESCDTIATFYAVHGSNAPSQWVTQHNQQTTCKCGSSGQACCVRGSTQAQACVTAGVLPDANSFCKDNDGLFCTNTSNPQNGRCQRSSGQENSCRLPNGNRVDEGFTCVNGKPQFCVCQSDGCSFHDTDVNSCNQSCGNPGQAYCNNQGQGGDPTEAGNGNGCIEKVPGEGIARRNNFGVCRGADTPSCAQTNTQRPASCTCNQNSQCASGECTNYNCEAPQTPTNTPTPTRTPTPTLLPGQPTATTVPGQPTVTPIPGGVQAALDLKLEGIGGAGETQTPATPTRTVTVELFDASEQPISGGTKTGTVTFDATSKHFKGTVDMGLLSAGSYIIKIKTDRHLKKRVAKALSPGTVTVSTTLLAGDIDGDNDVDVNDWNISSRNCFGVKATTASCGSSKTNADINDDNKWDIIDTNIIFKNLGTRQGD